MSTKKTADQWFAEYGESHQDHTNEFIGHKIEGKKPSFLKDVQFLLIGPAWLMHFIYRKLGIGY